jgi:DNA-binding MarR family transcriptional regulator
VYGFVLLALQIGPIPCGALSELLGVTKQSTSKLVEEMAAAGYLTKTVGTEDARQKPLILTDRGRDLLHAVERIYGDLEARWGEVIGTEEVERLRQGLTAVLTDGGRRELPAIRPTW